MQGRTDGDEGKAPTKERVPGVSDLDFSPFLFFWVLEGGIELIDRLIPSIRKHC
jgi:hypothetical protein